MSVQTDCAPAAGYRTDEAPGRRARGMAHSRTGEAGGAGHHGGAPRGRLRVYLGVAPGAGTTCALLCEGHRQAERGVDVVVAGVQTHARPGTAELLAGLEIIPPARVAYRDTVIEEMDLGAVLARRSQVALVDELAHRNPPGLGHATRWQEAQELLAAGIDVISTISIGQLDSLADVVEKITGVPLPETVPDPVIRAADEIELVDLAPEKLRDPMAPGHMYPPGQAALADRLGIGALSALRELALLWLAATLAQHPQRYRPGGHGHDSMHVGERVVVALPDGQDGQTLMRRAARIAARSGADLLAVHITRPGRPADAARLAARRQLTESVGGTYHELTDHNIPTALLTFAHSCNATQLVLGTGHHSRLSALRPRTRIRPRVIHDSGGTDVHIINCTRPPPLS